MSNETIRTKYLEEDDCEPLSDLFTRVWGKEGDSEYFRWKYFSRENQESSIVLHSGDEMVGFCGTLSFRNAFTGEGVRRCIQLVDLMIDEGQRSRFAWRAIGGFLLDRVGRDSMIYGIGNRYSYQAVTRLFDRQIRLRAEIPTVTTILNAAAYMKAQKGVKLPALKISQNLHRLRLRLAQNSGYDLVKVQEFSEEYDGLWERVKERLKWAVVRDSSFLTWRYEQCPGKRYTIFEARRNGNLQGYMISAINSDEGYRRGFIVDWLLPRGQDALFSALLAATLNNLLDERADTGTFWWCPALDDYRNVLRSYFFFKRPAAKLFLIASRSGDRYPELADFANYFIAFGDFDFI